MKPLASRDLQALELGFLADRVLDALHLYSAGEHPLVNRSYLDNALNLMEGLASGVGTDSANVDVTLRLNAINSFSYAAEALRSAGSARIPDGLRSHFGRLASTLRRVLESQEVAKEDLANLTGFFAGLSEATLASWGIAQLGSSGARGGQAWTTS